jgi:hypothetical protein
MSENVTFSIVSTSGVAQFSVARSNLGTFVDNLFFSALSMGEEKDEEHIHSLDITTAKRVNERWQRGYAELFASFFASPDQPEFLLPDSVELEDAHAVMDYFGFPFSLVERLKVTPADDWGLRARANNYRGCLPKLDLAMNHLEHLLFEEHALNLKWTIAVVPSGFNLRYANLAYEDDKLLTLGISFGEELERFGHPNHHAVWAESENFRELIKNRIEARNLEVVWRRERLETSGPRGLDYPPMDMETVHRRVWLLKITVPAVKKRKVGE